MKPTPENTPDESQNFGFLREVLRGAVLNYFYRSPVRRLLAEPEKRVFPRLRPPVLFRYLRTRRTLSVGMALSSPPNIFAGDRLQPPGSTNRRADRTNDARQNEPHDPTDTSDWWDTVDRGAALISPDDNAEHPAASQSIPPNSNNSTAAGIANDAHDPHDPPASAFDLLNQAAIQLPVIRAIDPAPPGATTEHFRETVPTRETVIQENVRQTIQRSFNANTTPDATDPIDSGSAPADRMPANFPEPIVDRASLSPPNSPPRAVNESAPALNRNATRKTSHTPQTAAQESMQPASGAHLPVASALDSVTSNETPAAFAQSLDVLSSGSRGSRTRAHAVATDALASDALASDALATNVSATNAFATGGDALQSHGTARTSKVRYAGSTRLPQVRGSLWRLAGIDEHGERPATVRAPAAPPMPQRAAVLLHTTPVQSATPAQNAPQARKAVAAASHNRETADVDAPMRSHFTQRGYISRPRMRPLR